MNHIIRMSLTRYKGGYKSGFKIQSSVKSRFAYSDMIASIIPFFLAVQLPIEDGAWPYGPEYNFTAYINVTGIPQCPHHVPTCGDPFEFHITFRLYCIPKRNDTLSCSLCVNDFGMIDEEVNRQRYTIDVPFELFFNEKGIESIIMSQLMAPTRNYNFNILRMIAEQLHPGDNFNNIGGGTFEGVTTSIIGRCDTIFNVYHRFGTENAKMKFPRGFRLKLPWRLHMTSTETLVIDKTTNLNSCSHYADGYFHKYATVIFKDFQANLENMVSHMEISETSFSSSTTRKGTSVSWYNTTYNITEITKLILKDIQPAVRNPPVIMKPGGDKMTRSVRLCVNMPPHTMMEPPPSSNLSVVCIG